MFCSLALAAVLLNAHVVSAVDSDAEFRALMRLPRWTREIGASWTDSGRFRMTGDTPLAREALAAARKAARERPDDPAAQTQVYKLLTQIGESAETVALARRIVTLWEAEAAKHPKDWKAQTELALALERVGENYAAVASARWAVALAPRESGAWLNLALRLEGEPTEATRAMDKAVALAPDDDLNTRVHQALMRLRARQRLLDRLPAVADPAAQGAVIAEVHQALVGIDNVLVAAAKQMKAANSTCGPDTRERCCAVMMMRDVLRAKLRALAASGPRAELEEPFIVVLAASGPNVQLPASSVKLLREFIPPTSDDLTQVFAAASFSSLATSGAEPGGAAARSAAEPYLRRMKELSDDRSPARAATALFLRGMLLEHMKDFPGAESCFRRAVRLVPTFDLAWDGLTRAAAHNQFILGTIRSALLGKNYTANWSHMLGIVREWAARSGSAYARFQLADTQASLGDWPAAERTLAAALEKYPDDLWLMMARATCRLRTATTDEEFNVISQELLAVNARLGRPGAASRALRKEMYWIVALCAARHGDIAVGRRYAEAYAQWADEKHERADAAALRHYFDHLAALPSPPARPVADRANAPYRPPGDAKQPSKATPSRVYNGIGSALFDDNK